MSVTVAVVHDYLAQRGGAERVALALAETFPGARVVTSVYDPSWTFDGFQDHRVETLWLNRFPRLAADVRKVMPLLPQVFGSRVVDDVDVVVCSSSGWAHGIRTPAPKLVYCHNPPRWLHQTQDYLRDQRLLARLGLAATRPALRRWDRWAAGTATGYVANSSTVARRVKRAYGIDAEVLHPPMTLDASGPQKPVDGLEPGFLLTVARPRAYKNTTAVAEAVERLPGVRLVVVGELPPGEAPHSGRIRALGGVSDEELRWLYAHCSALVAVGAEDFGLTPVEANAFGKPVVALRAGGYLDSQVEGVTAVFVDRPSAVDVADGIREVLAQDWSEAALRRNAARFAPEVFAQLMRGAVERLADGWTPDSGEPLLVRVPLDDAPDSLSVTDDVLDMGEAARLR